MSHHQSALRGFRRVEERGLNVLARELLVFHEQFVDGQIRKAGHQNRHRDAGAAHARFAVVKFGIADNSVSVMRASGLR